MNRPRLSFRSSFERIRDPLLIVGPDGRIRESNGAARSVLDFGDQERIADLRWLDGRVVFDGEEMLSLVLGGTPVVGLRLRDREGNDADVVVDILDLSGAKDRSQLKLIHIRDFSSYTHYERWKDDLISMVAHEVKNPLAAMRNSMHALSSQVSDAMTEAQKNLFGVSIRSIDRLTRLLDNVLDISRIGAGSYTPEPRRVNAREFTADVVETFRALFNVRRHEITHVVSEEVGDIYVDAPKLEQILINLLSNAIKFTPEGGEVSVNVEPAGLEVLGDDLRILPWSRLGGLRFIRFTVKDTGIGMAEETLSHLFTRYHEEAGRGGQRGSHLGLSISKTLVDAQNGSLAFESELGVGTRVTVSLPADQATYSLLARINSIARVLGRMKGLKGDVVARVFFKDESALWPEVIDRQMSGPVLNPTVEDEESGNSFVWALGERVALSLAAEGAGAKRSQPRGSSAPAEGCGRTRRDTCPTTSYRVPAREARAAGLLSVVLRDLEGRGDWPKTPAAIEASSCGINSPHRSNATDQESADEQR